MFRFSRENFLASDYTVPINSTQIDGAGFNSRQIPLAFAEKAAISFYVKGNHASCSLAIIFKFAAFDSKRNKWDTIDVLNSGSGVSVTANGTTAVQMTIAIEPDFEKIKLLSIQNQETTALYTVDVNVSIFVK
jgi:hypothetical protein